MKVGELNIDPKLFEGADSRYRYGLCARDGRTILVRDDGYRIDAVQVEPDSGEDTGEWFHIMEYKYSEGVRLDRPIIDALFSALTPVKPPVPLT